MVSSLYYRLLGTISMLLAEMVQTHRLLSPGLEGSPSSEEEEFDGENKKLWIPSRLIWFDQARSPEAEMIQPYRLQKQGLGQVSMFYHDPNDMNIAPNQQEAV